MKPKVALFDLDHTLLPIDSDYSWGEFTQQIGWTDPVVFKYAQEIAGDEEAHVIFLRQALGGAAVAQPTIDISAAGAFTAAARGAMKP